MKNLRLPILVVALSVLGSACKKEGIEIENVAAANVAVINAAPGTPALNVYIDTAKHNATTVAYLGTTSQTASGLIYNPVLSGNRLVDVRSSTATAPAPALVSKTYDFQAGNNYSVFVYDTIGMLKMLRLRDDLTAPPDSNSAHIRFVNLSPATTAANFDITFLRTATPADSVTMTNKAYVGGMANPDETAMSAFTRVPAGTYTVKLKQPGTQTVITTFTSIAIGRGRVLTLFTTGGVKATSVSLRTFRHL
jgi:hypothetical protein